MKIIIVGRNERIIIDNVNMISDVAEHIILNSMVPELLTIEVNGHLLVKSSNFMIEKRCLICNEVFIDCNNNPDEYMEEPLPFE